LYCFSYVAEAPAAVHFSGCNCSKSGRSRATSGPIFSARGFKSQSGGIPGDCAARIKMSIPFSTLWTVYPHHALNSRTKVVGSVVGSLLIGVVSC